MASTYKSEPPLTGDESRVTEVTNVPFPELLHPIDDQPPATVITSVQKSGADYIVRGTCEDNGEIKQVVINGLPAKAVRPNYAEWEVTLSSAQAGVTAKAMAIDAAGNSEKLPHTIAINK